MGIIESLNTRGNYDCSVYSLRAGGDLAADFRKRATLNHLTGESGRGDAENLLKQVDRYETATTPAPPVVAKAFTTGGNAARVVARSVGGNGR